MENHSHVHVEGEEEQKNNPLQVIRQIMFFKHVNVCATSRQSRLEDLMQRRSAKKWDSKKKAKMVRRLMTAKSELQEASGALEKLYEDLKQLSVTQQDTNIVTST